MPRPRAFPGLSDRLDGRERIYVHINVLIYTFILFLYLSPLIPVAIPPLLLLLKILLLWAVPISLLIGSAVLLKLLLLLADAKLLLYAVPAKLLLWVRAIACPAAAIPLVVLLVSSAILLVILLLSAILLVVLLSSVASTVHDIAAHLACRA